MALGKDVPEGYVKAKRTKRKEREESKVEPQPLQVSQEPSQNCVNLRSKS